MGNIAFKPKLFDLQTIVDSRGKVTVFEDTERFGFQSIKRIYYLHDVEQGSERGGHAHLGLHQIMIVLSGSMKAIFEKADFTSEIILNCPTKALHIQPGTWRILSDFEKGTVCLVLASEEYDEGDYIRDYETFKNMTIRGVWNYDL
jgi:oxalate decarboxylase/phosphoglucose isomerase-like protein (cupin superfamily)